MNTIHFYKDFLRMIMCLFVFSFKCAPPFLKSFLFTPKKYKLIIKTDRRFGNKKVQTIFPPDIYNKLSPFFSSVEHNLIFLLPSFYTNKR